MSLLCGPLCAKAENSRLGSTGENSLSQTLSRTLQLERTHIFSSWNFFQSVLFESHMDLASESGGGGSEGPCPGVCVPSWVCLALQVKREPWKCHS